MNKANQYKVTEQDYRTDVLKIKPVSPRVAAKQTAEAAGLLGGGCIIVGFYTVLAVGMIGLVYYLGALITCAIWNHMVVPAFHMHTITLFQGFVAWFVLSFISGFFTVRGGKSSAE